MLLAETRVVKHFKMQHLILIYCKTDAEKNRGYIDMYEQQCKRRGLDFSLKTVEDPGCGVTDHTAYVKELPQDAIVINRSRDWRLTRCLEEQGICVYNNSLVAELGNDKLKAIRYMEQLGIPVMKTRTTAPEIFPYVLKTIDGHGGNEVFLIKNEDDLKRYSQILKGRQLIFQEYCDTPGRDKRIYIVGNKVAGVMLRSSSDDFRSNYSLGGMAEVSELTVEEKKITDAILSVLTIGHAGIDLIYHNGRPVFNELEDVVGSRMLYRYTDIDVVDLFMDHIFPKTASHNTRS